MAAFLTRNKKLFGFVSLFLLCFAFYTLKLERTKPDTALACHYLRTNVVFIKTHKTASTSVMNLFHRFANKYQRLLVFPKVPFSLAFSKFHRSSVMSLKPGYNYSVLADHVIFDYEEMRAVMPRDTKYITILRDPVAQFQSLYNYGSLELIYGMNFSNFANLNISDSEEAKVIRKRFVGSVGINQMAFVLGIDPSIFDDETVILEKVRELDKQLDLVMITELFEQSLILMKEKLCWTDWNDVISFKINAIKSDYKARLSSEQKENLKRINRADQMIYDHFHQKLLRQIDAFGKEKMQAEVGKLRAATKDMYDLCVDEERTLMENENLEEVMTWKPKKEAESHKVCGDLTVNYFQLLASIFSKQKPFFSENELYLEWIDIVIGYSYYGFFFLRSVQSYFLRSVQSYFFHNHINIYTVVSQLLSSPFAFSSKLTNSPS